MMKIVFFGSAHFAVTALKALLKKGYQVCCVVTQPDKQKGRGLHLAATAVKELARNNNLEVYQPENINSPQAIDNLHGLSADLFVVVAYGKILSSQVLNIPKTFAINLHASVLPKYRGAAPINWAIIHGQQNTGASVIKMEAGVDTGPVILKKELPILSTDTAVTLEERLSHFAAGVLLEAMDLIVNNTYKLSPQQDSAATQAPKLKKSDGLINWQKSAREINDLIRGCLEWPGAFSYYQGNVLKIYKASVDSSTVLKNFSPGEITAIAKEKVAVATGSGVLNILELQLAGKRRMQAKDFISGHKIHIGETLGGKK